LGLAGFFIIIRYSSVKASVEKETKRTKFSESAETEREKTTSATSSKTGAKTPQKKKELSDYGSISTPVGRRSARIAVQSAQKDQ